MKNAFFLCFFVRSDVKCPRLGSNFVPKLENASVKPLKTDEYGTRNYVITRSFREAS